MVLYADLLFFINFSMDYLILSIVSRGLHKGKRMVLCSFFGGIYGVLSVIFSVLNNPFFQFLIGAMMVLISYQPKTVLQFLKFYFLFLAVAFLIGGILYHILTNSGQGFVINGVFYFDFSIVQFILLFFCCWIFLTVGSKLYHRFYNNGIKNVKIRNQGKEIWLCALIDTGCQLHEPITGFPVMIAEYDEISEVLSEELQGFVGKTIVGPIPEPVYQVPFSTVKEGNGLMTAFRPEQITIVSENNQLVLNRVLVGIVKRKLSDDQSYTALLNPSMII